MTMFTYLMDNGYIYYMYYYLTCYDINMIWYKLLYIICSPTPLSCTFVSIGDQRSEVQHSATRPVLLVPAKQIH